MPSDTCDQGFFYFSLRSADALKLMQTVSMVIIMYHLYSHRQSTLVLTHGFYLFTVTYQQVHKYTPTLGSQITAWHRYFGKETFHTQRS